MNNGSRTHRHQIYDSEKKALIDLKEGVELAAIRAFFKCMGVPSELGIKKIDVFEDIINDSMKDVHSGHKCQWLCRKAYYDGDMKAVSEFCQTYISL